MSEDGPQGPGSNRSRNGEGMDMDRGLIFDIQRYSMHDGPGIRTTVFMDEERLRSISKTIENDGLKVIIGH
jgi:hypothetical protein